MKLSAIVLARVIAFLETAALNPKGQLSYIDFSKAVVERYTFVKFPEKIEDYDPQKGVEFVAGKLNGIAIERATLFAGGIVIDTRSSTDDADRILEDALQWASNLTGLSSPPRIVQRAYVSQLNYYSDVRLPLVNTHFQNLASKISEGISSYMGQMLQYELVSLNFNFDLTTSKFAPGPFTIERAVDIPFSENKYFSTAPLPTNQHLALLEEFEVLLASSAASA